MKFEIRLDANAHRDFDRHVAYFESHDDLRHRIIDLEDDLLTTLDLISERPLLRPEVHPTSVTKHSEFSTTTSGSEPTRAPTSSMFLRSFTKRPTHTLSTPACADRLQ